MDLYIKNVTFCIWLNNFWFETFGSCKKVLFFYKFVFILANEIKKIISVFAEKKNIFTQSVTGSYHADKLHGGFCHLS